MAKIGVGVGEEFPVEDEAAASPRQEAGPAYGCGPGDWYAWKAARRAARAEWRAARAEWRARRRAAQAEYWAGQAGAAYPSYRSYRGFPFILPVILLVLLLAGAVSIIAAAPFFVLGAIVLAVLWTAHRHGRRNFYDVPPSPPARR